MLLVQKRYVDVSLPTKSLRLCSSVKHYLLLYHLHPHFVVCLNTILHSYPSSFFLPQLQMLMMHWQEVPYLEAWQPSIPTFSSHLHYFHYQVPISWTLEAGLYSCVVYPMVPCCCCCQCYCQYDSPILLL